MSGDPRLADALDAVLPQTQCTRCGYPDCRSYAVAIAAGEAGIDRCPPGGAEGIVRLAALTGREPRSLDPACGTEGPRRLADPHPNPLPQAGEGASSAGSTR